MKQLLCKTTGLTLVIALATYAYTPSARANGSLPLLPPWLSLQDPDSETPPPMHELASKPVLESQKSQEVDETPAYKRWWFWALTGAVVGGTVALAMWAAKPATQPPRPCASEIGLVCFGDGRP